HCLDDRRMTVAHLRDRDPGEEVEVLVAVGVPQARPLAAHELDRVPRVGWHQVFALECLQLGHAHAVIFVPIPPSVNSSSSTLWGVRPSTMCALVTPPSTAPRQASSFGRIPPETSPIDARTWPRLAAEINSPSAASHPCTSVRKTIL